MNRILELLYAQQTDFLESSFEKVYSTVHHKIKQRSLLLLFTNFESVSSMQRQLPYLKRLAHKHLLVVVFFENTELEQLIEREAQDTEDIYIKTIASKFAYEKKRIVRELKKSGIQSVLSKPADLTVNTINKYLEMKARRLI
jgi:uncharacterized protein (DUF58 family)